MKLEIGLTGPMRIVWDGKTRPVPASRKTRAILGYVIMSPRPVTRQRLCELFFDVPDDPRAALRWSLTKIRPLVDDKDTVRLVSERDTLRFNSVGAKIDGLTLAGLEASDVATVSNDMLSAAIESAIGEFLEDSDLPDRPEFSAWLAGMRQTLRNTRLRLLQEQARRLAEKPEEQLKPLRRILEIDPLDAGAWQSVAQAEAALSRPTDASETLEIGRRAFHQMGLAIPAILNSVQPKQRTSAEPVSSATREGAVVGEGVAPSAQGPPSIAVLPFADVGPTPIPAWLLDGLLDGVAYALSMFRSLRLIANASTRKFGGALTDPREIGAALGAEMLVGASVSQMGDDIRIRWRLIQAENGTITASGECRGIVSDIWAMQEDAASQIVSRIEPAAQEAVLKKLNTRPTQSRTAYELHLQGLHAAFGSDRSDYTSGLAFFRAALHADSDFVPSAAMAPWAAAYGNLITSAEEAQYYAEMARSAARRASDDARSLAIAATAVFYLSHDYAFGERAVTRALDRNPNEYAAWTCGGWISLQLGRYEEAMERFARAEGLNPLAYGRDGLDAGRAICRFFQGQFDEAERYVASALDNQPSNPSALATGVAIASRRNDTETLESRRALLLERYPEGLNSMAIKMLPFALPENKVAYFEALRAGGVPG